MSCPHGYKWRTKQMKNDPSDRIKCPEEENGKGGELQRIELALLRETRTIVIAKEVDRDLMNKVTNNLLYLEHIDPQKPITVFVNSPGGDADSGFAIYDVMKFVESPVSTVVAGLCASAGVIIFLGGDKGQRVSTPHSRFLIHQPSTGAQGQTSDIEITAKEIIKTRDRYNRVVAEETGIVADKIVKDANRDFWLSASEAVEYGLVDRIAASRNELNTAK